MAHYPIEADKLLVAAGLLVPDSPGRGRPSFTAHRRGVSTAYYAVFHAIAERVVRQAFPSADTLFRDRVRRWISHTDVKTVSTWLGKLAGTLPGSPPAHIAALLAPTGDPLVDADTLAIADGFLELHEKREQADYDHHAVFTRPDTLGLLELARQTVATVEAVASDESSLMFGLIAMQSRVQPRRAATAREPARDAFDHRRCLVRRTAISGAAGTTCEPRAQP